MRGVQTAREGCGVMPARADEFIEALQKYQDGNRPRR